MLSFSGNVTEKTDYAVAILYMHIQMARTHPAHLSRDSLQQQSAMCLLLSSIVDDKSYYSLNKYGSISFPLTIVWEQIYSAVRRKNRCSILASLRKHAPLINFTYFFFYIVPFTTTNNDLSVLDHDSLLVRSAIILVETAILTLFSTKISFYRRNL